ncbi:hypothetical protein [Ensifer sp. SL37]|uniref:hypothetical protein n=1 Tax=Ensifer sp. SL37 TaxID=2995137 RepID=UPI002272F412|nr:hypothetical protein [Ensifer sp. SL37]MCY1741153.1 hypothetical protein [Ensifer sp. SL37]
MATYEVEINGQTFEIDAPNDAAVQLAVRQLQSQSGQSPAPQGRHLSYEEGVAEMEKERLGGTSGEIGAALTGYIGDLPIVGPALLGATERGAAGIASLVNGDSYGDNLTRAQQTVQTAQEENPYARLAGGVAGNVATFGALGSTGLGARVLGNTGSLGARVLTSGLSSGTISGADAAIRGKDGREIATQAALGTVLGGALPLVARGASAAYQNIADRFAGNTVARAAGVRPEVARMLTDTLESDATLGARGQANMARAGGEAMLADAGPNARAVLDTAIQRGGSGALVAREAIEGRVGRSAQDLTTILDDTLGAPQGVFTAREGIRTGTSGARGAAYRSAYEQPINYADPRGMAVEQLIKTRVPQSAINEANALMRVEGASSKQILAKVADDGSVVFETLPDVQQLDYITRGLNEVAKKGEAAGAMGGQTALGRAYEGLSREIRSNLRDLVPEYGQALDIASDAIGQSKAVELGSKALSPSVSRDVFADALDGMTAAERRGVSQGIRSQIDEKVANVTRAVQDGNMDAREAIKGLKDLSSRAAHEKLTALLGQSEADRLINELDRISSSFELRASVAENSKTYARQAVSGRIDEMTAPGAIGTAAQGKPINALQRVAQALTGQTPEAINARQNAIYSEIAEFLTRPAARSIPAFQAMTNFGSQTAANQSRAALIDALISGTGRPLVYPASERLNK